MISWEVVFGQIASVLAVIALGWVLLRVRILPAETLRPLCRLVLDVTLPALIFTRFLASVTAETLAASWYLPLLGAGLVAFAHLLAWAGARFGGGAHRPTLEFCAAFPNWFYLALAVLEPVFGHEATRLLLLYNIGIHAYIWSFGLLPFGGEKTPLAARLLRAFLTPPLMATALGILAVFLLPDLAALSTVDPGGVAALPAGRQVLFLVWQALEMIADITIPLTLLTVGAQLATATFTGHGGLWGTVWGSLLRLVVIPALTLAALAAACAFGWRPTTSFFLITFLTAAMPTAVVCGQVAELYDGDAPLASRLTFLTTLASLATVPLWSVAARWAAGMVINN